MAVVKEINNLKSSEILYVLHHRINKAIDILFSGLQFEVPDNVGGYKNYRKVVKKDYEVWIESEILSVYCDSLEERKKILSTIERITPSSPDLFKVYYDFYENEDGIGGEFYISVGWSMDNWINI